MDKIDLMNTAADNTTAATTPNFLHVPPYHTDAPEPVGDATPLGLRSSPPTIRPPADSPSRPAASHVATDAASQSDSEAETVVLPGIDGYSPSKIRRERKIKLEDKVEDSESDRGGAGSRQDDHVGTTLNAGRAAVADDGVSSLLGKRKRPKHRIPGLDDTLAGNSSGLSSVPTSPVVKSRSNLARQVDSDSEYPSPSPKRTHSERVPEKKRSIGSASDLDKEFKPTHNRRSSVRDASAGERHKEGRTKASSERPVRHRRTHSPSPSRNRDISDNNRGHRATSSSGANGLGTKKRWAPPSSRAKKYTEDELSDESSAIESSHTRRSKPRKRDTPPVRELPAQKVPQPPPRKRFNRWGRTALLEASVSGNYEKVKKLLDEYPEDLDLPDSAGNTALQCASLDGYDEVVKLLIRHGCNIHCINHDGDSPLIDAIDNGHLQTVKLLLDAGVDPRQRNRLGQEPLQLVKDDEENAEEIKKAVLDARAKFQPSGTLLARQEPCRLDDRRKASASHARANRTEKRFLYMQFDLPSLREAAAIGDVEKVVNIVEVLEQNISGDPESAVAAAKGGHAEVLGILFAMAGCEPDPPPLESADSWEYATPILAAIGGDNTKVLELLLSMTKEGRLDPTKRYERKTYFEIASERAGRVWQEEKRLLKQAYNEYMGKATRDTKSSGSSKKPDENMRPKQSKMESRERPDMSSPIRRVPGRPRKENIQSSEHNPQSVSQRADEADNAKPRRKLVSGRELKDSQETTEPELPSLVVRTDEDHELAKPRRKLVSGRDLKDAGERNRPVAAAASPVKNGRPTLHDSPMDLDPRAESNKHLHSKPRGDSDREGEKPNRRSRSVDRRPSVRPSSPSKRHRNSSPVSGLEDAAQKRRRLETEPKQFKHVKASQESMSSTPTVRPLASIPKINIEKAVEVFDQISEDSQSPRDAESNRRSLQTDQKNVGVVASDDKQPTIKSEVVEAASSAKELAQKLARTQAKQAKKKADAEAQKKAEEAERKLMEDRKRLEQEKAAKKREEKIRQEEQQRIKEVSRRKEELARAAELRHQEELRHEEERARKVIEEDIRRETQAGIALDIEFNEEVGRRFEQTRKKREEAVKLRLQEQQELGERQKLEREAEEQRQREEVARRAHEERRRHEEAKQRHHEEMQRRKAEAIAERHREEAAARVANLPPLLRWFDGLSNPATPDVAKYFTLMYGARYDTIRPEAASTPEGSEYWVLNSHAALLLGKQDLDLSCYTGWDRIPASGPAKRGYWKLQGDTYSMTDHGLDRLNPDFAEYVRRAEELDEPWISIPPPVQHEVKKQSKELYLDLNLFFVKLSDLMFVVRSTPHLKDIDIKVLYHEVEQDPAAADHAKVDELWHQDLGAEELHLHAFCPGPRFYRNGQLVHVERSRVSRPASRTASEFEARTPIHAPKPAFSEPNYQPHGVAPAEQTTVGKAVETEPVKSSDAAAGNVSAVVANGLSLPVPPDVLQNYETLSPELVNGNGVRPNGEPRPVS